MRHFRSRISKSGQNCNGVPESPCIFKSCQPDSQGSSKFCIILSTCGSSSTTITLVSVARNRCSICTNSILEPEESTSVKNVHQLELLYPVSQIIPVCKTITGTGGNRLDNSATLLSLALSGQRSSSTTSGFEDAIALLRQPRLWRFYLHVPHSLL